MEYRGPGNGEECRQSLVRRPHVNIAVANVTPVATAHNSGTKKVLTRGFDQPVIIKQVAVGTLLPGEYVEPHSHADLDEYYFVLSGNGTMRVDGNNYELAAGDFVIVTAGSEHELRSGDKTLEFYYQSFELVSG
jgi:mannose-6-phosphate isomerase-like protein (cupin superfamily)